MFCSASAEGGRMEIRLTLGWTGASFTGALWLCQTMNPAMITGMAAASV
jgi:hypothetical protein